MTQFNSLSPANKLKIVLGSTVHFMSMTVLTFLFAPIVLFCLLFSFETRYRIAKTWADIVTKLAAVFCGIQYRVEGLENIDPERPAIIISNHQSAWETIAYRSILPRHTSLFKESLLWIPLWGWALASLKPIAINRNNRHSALKKLIKHGTEALQEGLWLLVFPEGTRRPFGQPGTFSAGGAIVAQKSGYPIVPIAHNAGKCWPRNSFLKYPGLITVKVGPYMHGEGKKSEEINRDAEQWIMQALSGMS